MKKILFMVFSALIFAGCKGNVKNQQIAGTWETSKFIINGVEQEIFPSSVTFSQTENNSYLVSGNSGVNSFSGKITVKENNYSAKKEEFLKTLALGDPKTQAFEDNFINILIDFDTFERNANSLVIKNSAQNAEIRFVQNLFGLWKTTSLIKNGVSKPIADSCIEITQSSSPNVFSISGNSGVNQFFGDIKIKGSKIVAAENNFGTTKMMGLPQLIEFEKEFLNVLKNAEDYNLTNGVLILKDSKTSSQITFER